MGATLKTTHAVKTRSAVAKIALTMESGAFATVQLVFGGHCRIGQHRRTLLWGHPMTTNTLDVQIKSEFLLHGSVTGKTTVVTQAMKLECVHIFHGVPIVLPCVHPRVLIQCEHILGLMRSLTPFANQIIVRKKRLKDYAIN